MTLDGAMKIQLSFKTVKLLMELTDQVITKHANEQIQLLLLELKMMREKK